MMAADWQQKREREWETLQEATQHAGSDLTRPRFLARGRRSHMRNPRHPLNYISRNALQRGSGFLTNRTTHPGMHPSLRRLEAGAGTARLRVLPASRVCRFESRRGVGFGDSCSGWWTYPTLGKAFIRVPAPSGLGQVNYVLNYASFLSNAWSDVPALGPRHPNYVL